MRLNKTGEPIGAPAASAWGRLARRRVALLGGTANFTDALLAASFLINPLRLLRGPAIKKYERAFAGAIGVRYAYSFSAARVGLYGILQALGVGPGDEVLLQVPTHIVVANAIRYTGARPIYADCDPSTYNLDFRDAERKMTPRTKVLVLQHTFGIPADIETAMALSQRHGVVVLEDCVHALGSRYGGRPVGSFGKAAFFSTEETKTITSTMGGMAVTDDPELAARMRAFQKRCSVPPAWLTARYLVKFILYYLLTEPHLHRYTRPLYEALGRLQPLPGATSGEEQRGAKPQKYEQRLSNAQAALALRQLERLQSNAAHRCRVAAAYGAQLSARGFRVPRAPATAEPVFVRYPIPIADRDAAQRACAPYAVLGTWFTSVLEEAVLPACGDYQSGSCPTAENLATQLINLPTHPRVGSRDVGAIVTALAKAARTANYQRQLLSCQIPAGLEEPPKASVAATGTSRHKSR